MRVLVVDDEPGIRDALTHTLGREGFAAAGAESLGAARAALAGVDLVVLDLGLPDGSGLDLLRELRAGADGGPAVLVLTSRDDEFDRVLGLELGADDYVVKPFSPREVTARIRAVLRRTARAATPTAAELRPVIDRSARRVRVAGREIALSKTEFDILAALADAPDQVFGRDALLAVVWGDVIVGERTIDVHVKALRKKIEDAGGDGDVIETVRGVGYRLRP